MKLYLDTNVIRDYLENRNTNSIQLLELARHKGWECVTSAFTMMEVADLEQDSIFFQKTVIRKKWDADKFLRERRQKELTDSDYQDLEEYLDVVPVRLPFLTFFNLSEDGWQIAQYIASHSVLSAVDTIHLATAYSAKSDIVVTNDSGFIKHGNKILEKSKRAGQIAICLPEKVEETAQKLGMTT
ncbi:MAG: PIN domain-containing protein [Candidatus Nomurabacteria bacterium]|nr:MAG: PIN domain-containing protein [Candidatus Nomurabacteria bacterium]